MSDTYSNGGAVDNSNLTLEKLLSMERLVPRIPPVHIRVHPARYREMCQRFLPCVQVQSNITYPMAGIRMIQDPYVPLHESRRVRRFLTKKQRNRWHVRKYRTVQVPVLGWLVQEDKITKIEWRSL